MTYDRKLVKVSIELINSDAIILCYETMHGDWEAVGLNNNLTSLLSFSSCVCDSLLLPADVDF